MNLFTLFAKLGLDTSEYDKNVDKATKKGKTLAQSLEDGIKSAVKFAAALKVGAAVIKSTINAVANVAKTGIEYNAQIETYKMSLATLLGSAQEAEQAIENIKQDAAATPFDVEGLVQANQLLIGAGISADNARKTIIALGDAVSATGGGSAELARMAANLQGIRNVGTATSADIKQFATAGINIYKVMADYLGTTTEQVQNMSIGYDDLSAALIKAASAGGMYEGAMKRQSQTFKGIMTTLKANAVALIGEVFQPLSSKLAQEILPQANKYLQELADAYRKGGTTAMIKATGRIIAKVIDAIISAAPKLLEGLFALLGALGEELVNSFPRIATLLTELLSKVVLWITSKNTIKSIISAIGTIVSSVAIAVFNALPDLIEGLVANAIDIIGSALSGEMFDDLLRSLSAVGLAMTEAICDIDWKYVIEKITTGISNAFYRAVYPVIKPLAHFLGRTFAGLNDVEMDEAYEQYFREAEEGVEARARARRGLNTEPMTVEEIKSAVGGTLGGAGNGQTTVVLEVDGEVFGEVVYNANQKQTQKYGTKITGG